MATRRGTVVALVVGLAALLPARADARAPDPHKAAAELVARIHHPKDCNFANSRVVTRGRRLWLAVGTTCFPKPSEMRTRVRIFRWSGRAWRQDGSVTGPLGPSQSLIPASLTGSRAPDFGIEGCGAGDTVCLSVVSRVGGRWHAIPFEYGYGTTLDPTAAIDRGRAVLVVNACHCAGGPTTETYMRYAGGRFVPTQPPGGDPKCRPGALAWAADPFSIQLLRFTQVRCAAGWALAVGDGAGSSGPVVGLFDREYLRRRWHLLALDGGNALPAAPALYALPLPLLERLAAVAGPTLAPHIAAAKLIAGLQRFGVFWPPQNGLVDAGGSRWLIAIVPAGPDPDDGSTPPVGAAIYRWDGTAWVLDGRVARVPDRLDAAYFGGWFVSTPAAEPSAVAFDLVGDCCGSKGDSVLTNAGGQWHVAPR